MENTNFQAYKHAKSVVDKFIDISKPLSQLNIKTFAYFRFFDNGKYLYLCNNLNWVRFCLENIHDNDSTALGKEINYVREDGYHCYLWPTQKMDYLLSSLYDFNIWNGLSIFKYKEDNSIELWGFASDLNSENMQNLYIENIDLLKDFTTLFNLYMGDAIFPKKSILATYKNFKTKNYLLNDEYDTKKIMEFLEATPIKKYPLITNLGEVFLSKRELQCINLLASGKTAKQIAFQLELSHRTVEKHIENLKNKAGCNDKQAIINIYRNSLIQWL